MPKKVTVSRYWEKVAPISSLILKPHHSWLERQLALQSLNHSRRNWLTIPLRNFHDIKDEIIATCASCLVGPDTVYDRSKQRRYIDHTKTQPSDGAIATEYIRTLQKAYATPNLDFIADRDLVMDEIPPLPAYWDGLSHDQEDLAYVDIASAYWSILRVFTLDTVIENGEVSIGRIQFLQPNLVEQSKGFRNAVYGVTRTPSTVQFYRFGQPVDDDRVSPFWNPYLSTCTVSTMVSIALEAMATVPVYMWLTDAAIVKASDAQKLVDLLENKWKLEARITKTGNARLTGYGDYTFGELSKIAHGSGEAVDNIDRTINPNFWLMTRLMMRKRHPFTLPPHWPENQFSEEAKVNWRDPVFISFDSED